MVELNNNNEDSGDGDWRVKLLGTRHAAHKQQLSAGCGHSNGAMPVVLTCASELVSTRAVQTGKGSRDSGSD